jgi:hypothetical protein
VPTDALDDSTSENRGALQAVAAGDEDVLDAAILQLGDDLEPELGAFGRLEPQAEDLLAAVDADAECEDDEGIEEDDRQIGSNGRLYQPVTSSTTAPVTVEMRSGDTPVPYTSARWAWMSRTFLDQEWPPPASR